MDGDPPASRKPVIFPSNKIKAPPKRPVGWSPAGAVGRVFGVWMRGNSPYTNQQTGGILHHFPSWKREIWTFSCWNVKDLQIFGLTNSCSCVGLGQEISPHGQTWMVWNFGMSSSDQKLSPQNGLFKLKSFCIQIHQAGLLKVDHSNS